MCRAETRFPLPGTRSRIRASNHTSLVFSEIAALTAAEQTQLIQLMFTRIPAANVRLKRAYARASSSDGIRILVDRLWPRGLSKVDAAIDQWAKELSPSTALRRWFGHDPERWEEFRKRYVVEVHEQPAGLEQLRALAREGTITLVFSARDEAHNDAVALRDFILRRRLKR